MLLVAARLLKHANVVAAKERLLLEAELAGLTATEFFEAHAAVYSAPVGFRTAGLAKRRGCRAITGQSDITSRSPAVETCKVFVRTWLIEGRTLLARADETSRLIASAVGPHYTRGRASGYAHR